MAGPAPPCGQCSRVNNGASYFLCSPDQCEDGWDANHGGSYKKDRFNHLWPLNIVATGPPGNEFSGNCWGDLWACADANPLGTFKAGSPGVGLGPIASLAVPRLPACAPVWFGQVNAVVLDGLAKIWYDDNCSDYLACDGSSCNPKDLPPPLPGIGLHDVNGTPLCNVSDTGHNCSCSMGDFPVCKAEEVWVAIDLNLDGSGRPYRNFPGRHCEFQGNPYIGEGVPRLRDYDLTKDPDTWMHSCPCETWTGANPCT